MSAQGSGAALSQRQRSGRRHPEFFGRSTNQSAPKKHDRKSAALDWRSSALLGAGRRRRAGSNFSFDRSVALIRTAGALKRPGKRRTTGGAIRRRDEPIQPDRRARRAG